MSIRYEIYKSDSPRKPWVVRDNASPVYENARLYRFSSRGKAKAFKHSLEQEGI